ncbi:MAG: DUF4345 domain-containing protein [Bacteroidota bacterium]
MRRALQITMLVVAAVPLTLGIVSFLFGAGQFLPAEHITASLDNQLRFYAIWFTAVFFLTVWCVRNLDVAGPVMRIMFIVMALGGVARLYSMSQVGLPDPPMIGAAIVEIGVLAFIPWHAAVVRSRTAQPDTSASAA